MGSSLMQCRHIHGSPVPRSTPRVLLYATGGPAYGEITMTNTVCRHQHHGNQGTNNFNAGDVLWGYDPVESDLWVPRRSPIIAERSSPWGR